MSKPIKIGPKFLSSADISRDELIYLLEIAEKLKNETLNLDCRNKVLGLIFDKSSTRTRVSFQVECLGLAAQQLI